MRNFQFLDLPNAQFSVSRFPNAQFLVSPFSKPFRLDRNRKGGGVMIYVRENIPSKLLTKHVLPSDIECIFLELNFRKCKWLLVGTYHPPSQNDHYFFENLDKKIDVCSHYEKVLLAGDFNAEISEFLKTLFFTSMSLRI